MPAISELGIVKKARAILDPCAEINLIHAQRILDEGPTLREVRHKRIKETIITIFAHSPTPFRSTSSENRTQVQTETQYPHQVWNRSNDVFADQLRAEARETLDICQERPVHG